MDTIKLVEYNTWTNRLTGRQFESLPQSCCEVVIHITNHKTYHRGQLTHMIRVVGEQPVGADYFIFCAQK